MYRLSCKNLPPAIKSICSLNSVVHSHFTRQASNFYIPDTRTLLAHKTIKHEGPMLWNVTNEHPRVFKILFIFNHVFKSGTMETYLYM